MSTEAIIWITFVILTIPIVITYGIYKSEHILRTLYKKFNELKRSNYTIANILSYMEKTINKRKSSISLNEAVYFLRLPTDELDPNKLAREEIRLKGYQEKDGVVFHEKLDVHDFVDQLKLHPNIDSVKVYQSFYTYRNNFEEPNLMDMLLKIDVGGVFMFIAITNIEKAVVADEVPSKVDQEYIKLYKEKEPPLYEAQVANNMFLLYPSDGDERIVKKKIIEFYIEQSKVYTIGSTSKAGLVTGIVQVHEEDGQYTLHFIHKNIKYHKTLFPVKSPPFKEIKYKNTILDCRGKEERVYEALKSTIKDPNDTGHIIIQGPPGVGKSTLFANLIRDISEEVKYRINSPILVLHLGDGHEFINSLRKAPSLLNDFIKRNMENSPNCKIVLYIDNGNNIINNKELTDTLANLLDGPETPPNFQLILGINSRFDTIREDIYRTGRIDTIVKLRDGFNAKEYSELINRVEKDLPSPYFIDRNKLTIKEDDNKYADIFAYIRKENINS